MQFLQKQVDAVEDWMYMTGHRKPEEISMNGITGAENARNGIS